MRALSTLLASIGFALSLYCSYTVLRSGKVQIAKYSDKLAYRSTEPVRYWIPTVLILSLTVVSGFSLKLMLTGERPNRHVDITSMPKKRK